jgi:hypothetical protein
MEVKGQLHAPAALPQRKETQVPVREEFQRPPELVYMRW